MQIFIAGLFFAALVGGYFALLPYIIKYSLADQRLEVRYAGFLSVRIPYGDIKKVELLVPGLFTRELTQPLNPKTLGESFSTCRMGTSFWGQCVSVETSKRFGVGHNRLFLTPKDPAKFVDELKSRCKL
jgi:hypothetical protein